MSRSIGRIATLRAVVVGGDVGLRISGIDIERGGYPSIGAAANGFPSKPFDPGVLMRERTRLVPAGRILLRPEES